MSDRSTALEVVVDVDGHLTIHPRSLRNGVSLTFLPDHLRVDAPGCAPMALPWAANGPVPSVMDRTSADVWTVTSWASGRSGEYGVGLQVAGTFVRDDDPLRRATTRFWQRWARSFERLLIGTCLPLVKGTTAFTAAGSERATLRALTGVPQRRPEARHHLGDPARMRRLAGDIATGMVSEPVAHDGVRRDTVDLRTAMRSEGLVHEFGRPFWSTATDADDAIDRVARRLAANPYRQDRSIERATVSDYVQRHYLDVRPWPFGALVDE